MSDYGRLLEENNQLRAEVERLTALLARSGSSVITYTVGGGGGNWNTAQAVLELPPDTDSLHHQPKRQEQPPAPKIPEKDYLEPTPQRDYIGGSGTT